MKNFIKEFIPYIIILIIVILIRSFIITPVVVIGTSMEKTLYEGEVLLLSKVTYKVSDIKRFDVVVIKEDNEKIIKRIIGLPGDYVEYRDNKLFINNKLVKDPYASNETDDFTSKDYCNCNKIPEGKYFVLGDNRAVSMDSRSIGLIDEKIILGKAVVRFWPLNKISVIN